MLTKKAPHSLRPRLDGASRARLAEISASHEHLADANAAPRCGHIKSDGRLCGSPALRGSVFCYYHDRYYNRPFDDCFPPLEDANAIQVALNQVLDRLRAEVFRKLDANAGAQRPLDYESLKAVNTLLYGLQTASANAKRARFDVFHHEMVTDLSAPKPPQPAAAAGGSTGLQPRETESK